MIAGKPAGPLQQFRATWDKEEHHRVTVLNGRHFRWVRPHINGGTFAPGDLCRVNPLSEDEYEVVFRCIIHDGLPCIVDEVVDLARNEPLIYVTNWVKALDPLGDSYSRNTPRSAFFTRHGTLLVDNIDVELLREY